MPRYAIPNQVMIPVYKSNSPWLLYSRFCMTWMNIFMVCIMWIAAVISFHRRIPSAKR
ncbi:Uncharacterised protein [Vibrio cholerae]|nr:Uncharacterised protein [Vibrio cholerae]